MANESMDAKTPTSADLPATVGQEPHAPNRVISSGLESSEATAETMPVETAPVASAPIEATATEITPPLIYDATVMTVQDEDQAEIEARAQIMRVILGVYGATSIALGAVFGPIAMSVAVALLGIGFIIGWPRLLGLENRFASRIALCVILASLIVVNNLTNTDISFTNPISITGTLFVMVGAVMAAFIVEMLRRDGRERLVEHLAGTISGAMILGAGSLWIVTVMDDDGSDVAVTVAIALAAVATIHSFDSRAAQIVGIFNGIVFVAGSAIILSLPWWTGLLAGTAVGLSYLLTARAAEGLQRPSRRLSGLARSATPILALGVIGFAMVAYVL